MYVKKIIAIMESLTCKKDIRKLYNSIPYQNPVIVKGVTVGYPKTYYIGTKSQHLAVEITLDEYQLWMQLEEISVKKYVNEK